MKQTENKNSNKIKVSVYLNKDTLERCDDCLDFANARSRNEFITKAVEHYIGFLSAENGQDFLLPELSKIISAQMNSSENRIARVLFKLSVEVAKQANITAFCNDIEYDNLKKLHANCIEEVKRINGTIKLEDAVKIQNRGE